MRRWVWVLVCLLATTGLTYYVSTLVAPTYESRADVVLLPPQSVEDPTSNRYLALGGVGEAVDVLTRSLSSESTREAVKEIAPRGTFKTESDATTDAPILVVTAQAATPADARRVLDAAVGQVPIALRELQDSVDIAKSNQITAEMVASDEKPKAVNKKQIRAVAAAAAFLLLLSALVIGGIDNRLLRLEGERALAEQKARLKKTREPGNGSKRSAKEPAQKATTEKAKEWDAVPAKVSR